MLIDEYGLAEFSPILAQEPAVVLAQSLRRWLTTAHASIQVIHKSSIGFKSSDLNGQGSTVTFWLARKSTVARACDNFLHFNEL
jgi:hypothetical protein